MKYLAILFLSFLCGCGPSASEANHDTLKSLSTPEFIGNLKNGKKLYRVEVSRQGSDRKDRVYYTDDGTLNTNYSVTYGKTTVLESNGAIE